MNGKISKLTAKTMHCAVLGIRSSSVYNVLLVPIIFNHCFQSEWVNPTTQKHSKPKCNFRNLITHPHTHWSVNVWKRVLIESFSAPSLLSSASVSLSKLSSISFVQYLRIPFFCDLSSYSSGTCLWYTDSGTSNWYLFFVALVAQYMMVYWWNRGPYMAVRSH